MNLITPSVVALSLALVIPGDADSQVYLVGEQMVTWQLEDRLRPYALDPVSWTSIGYTLTTSNGAQYHGHHAPDGTPQPAPVSTEKSSFGRLKVMADDSPLAKSSTDSITLVIYRDADGDNVVDSHDSNNPSYLSFTDEFDLGAGGNDLGVVIMIEDRVVPGPDGQISNDKYDINGNGIADLEIEHVGAVRGAPATGTFAGKILIRNVNTQNHYINAWTNTAEQIQRAQAIDSEFNANPTDASHDFSSLAPGIATVPFTGTSPRTGDHWDLEYVPESEIEGQTGDFDPDINLLRINESNDVLTQEKTLRAEKWGARGDRGIKSFSDSSVSNSQKRALRFLQLYAGEIMELAKYSLN